MLFRSERTIRLTFALCTHAPERTLVLGLELSGSVYEAIQKNANIRLPPPASYSRYVIYPATNGDLSEPSSASLPTSSTPASTSSLSYQSTSAASIPVRSILTPKTSGLQIAQQSSETSSANTLVEDCRDMSIGHANTVGSREIHRRAIPGDSANCLADLPSDLHDVIEELRQNNASRDRQIQEMKEGHDAQTRKLNEALAELAQLKALLIQNPMINGAVPLQTALAPP